VHWITQLDVPDHLTLLRLHFHIPLAAQDHNTVAPGRVSKAHQKFHEKPDDSHPANSGSSHPINFISVQERK
jgi:hypothetical protein